MNKYSIIIPAYNEEKRIAKTLILYDNYFRKIGSYEIIVVCDGCMDRTPEIVRELAKTRKRIKLTACAKRLGKGGGIIEGVRFSKGSLIGFTDADACVSPGDFFSLFEKLNDYDCVIGSRRISGSKITKDVPPLRKASSALFNIAVNILFKLSINDTQCGAKVFRRSAIKSMEETKTRGFEFDAEFLWKLKKNGFSIQEAPIEWAHKGNSRFSLVSGIGMLANLIKVWLGLFSSESTHVHLYDEEAEKKSKK